jgi:glycosyltransferase involved in cell wall biosynthesis
VAHVAPPLAASAPDGARPQAAGANVIGFFQAEFGQGEVARRLAAALEQGGVPFSTVTLREIPHRYIPHRQEHPFVERRGGEYGTNILCVNAEHVPAYYESVGRELLGGRYTVGVWFWETSRFPAELQPALDVVDEVWVASRFVEDAVASETWKPVLTFPLPVEPPREPMLRREDLALPEAEFVFLFVFDFFSTLERKNAIGLVEAFKQAFPPESGAFLLIKTINGNERLADLELLRTAVGGHPDIRVHDGFISPDQIQALTAHADCYVSLHRSEGFGLTIAEAMAYGKPAIATAYSGNLTFMNDDNSYLVPWAPMIVPEECGPYPAGAEWADPDLEAAAALMRHVYEHPEEARERAQRGRQTVLQRHSLERTGSFLSERLMQIERLRTERERVTTPARRVNAYVAAGPSTSWEAPSRFGFFGRLYRRLLRRALQPVLVRQREFELAVAAGLEQAEEMGRQQRDRLNRLEEVARRLDAQVDQLTALAAALDRRVSDERPQRERQSD